MNIPQAPKQSSRLPCDSSASKISIERRVSILFLESVLQQDRHFGIRVKGRVDVSFVDFLRGDCEALVSRGKGRSLTASAP